jgi:hypothetical protein
MERHMTWRFGFSRFKGRRVLGPAALVAAVLTSGGCNGDLVTSGTSIPPPVIRPPVGGVFGSYLGVVEPSSASLEVGQTIILRFRVEPTVAFGEVNWTTASPGLIRLESPTEECGTRCAAVTGLASGRAGIVASTIVSGEEVWVVDGVAVR